MKTYIQKWGHSLALRIPKPFAAEIGLQDASAVDLSLVDGKLVVAPLGRPPLALAQLLAQVTADNLPGEVDTGPACGSEVG